LPNVNGFSITNISLLSSFKISAVTINS